MKFLKGLATFAGFVFGTYSAYAAFGAKFMFVDLFSVIYFVIFMVAMSITVVIKHPDFNVDSKAFEILLTLTAVPFMVISSSVTLFCVMTEWGWLAGIGWIIWTIFSICLNTVSLAINESTPKAKPKVRRGEIIFNCLPF